MRVTCYATDGHIEATDILQHRGLAGNERAVEQDQQQQHMPYAIPNAQKCPVPRNDHARQHLNRRDVAEMAGHQVACKGTDIQFFHLKII